MENFLHMLNNPVIAGFFGFGIGIVLVFIVTFKAWMARRSLEHENASIIRSHLKIHASGTNSVDSELEGLKKQNENLRITLANMKTKTDKSDLLTLESYYRAIRLMTVKAPGFAQAWEATLAEVEIEMLKIDNGLVAWIKKTVRPSITNRSTLDIQFPKDTQRDTSHKL